MSCSGGNNSHFKATLKTYKRKWQKGRYTDSHTRQDGDKIKSEFWVRKTIIILFDSNEQKQ